jgi:glucose/arabinose dehydrogenase
MKIASRMPAFLEKWFASGLGIGGGFGLMNASVGLCPDRLRATAITGFTLALSLSGEAVRASNLGIDPLFGDRFQITEFATGLDFPNGILQLNDGSMLIGTTNGNGFFDANAKSQLVRFQDTNGDGVADNRTVLYDGLSGGVTAIRAVDNYLFVTSIGDSRISVFQTGSDFSANSLTLKGSIDFSFPSGTVHATDALAVRQTGSQQFELFFNVGAAGNNQATSANSITLNSGDFGLATTNLSGDSIYKIPVTVGSSLTIDKPVRVATGLRNAAGLEFNRATGDLYIVENGIDGLPVSQGGTGPNEPLTADELNRLTSTQLASSTVENFGFPNYGEKYRSPGAFIDGLGQTVNSSDPSLAGVIGAIANFQPIPNPNTGAESEGAASIAFAPVDFPTGLNNGVFVGFFGRFLYGANDDRENALVYYDLATNSYLHFLSTNRGGDFGHFTSLLSTQDSLFAVDIGTGSGALFSSAGLGRGTVYQIQSAQSVPEPFTIIGTLIGGTAAVRLRKKLTSIAHK